MLTAHTCRPARSFYPQGVQRKRPRTSQWKEHQEAGHGHAARSTTWKEKQGPRAALGVSVIHQSTRLSSQPGAALAWRTGSAPFHTPSQTSRARHFTRPAVGNWTQLLEPSSAFCCFLHPGPDSDTGRDWSATKDPEEDSECADNDIRSSTMLGWVVRTSKRRYEPLASASKYQAPASILQLPIQHWPRVQSWKSEYAIHTHLHLVGCVSLISKKRGITVPQKKRE